MGTMATTAPPTLVFCRSSEDSPFQPFLSRLSVVPVKRLAPLSDKFIALVTYLRTYWGGGRILGDFLNDLLPAFMEQPSVQPTTVRPYTLHQFRRSLKTYLFGWLRLQHLVTFVFSVLYKGSYLLTYRANGNLLGYFLRVVGDFSAKASSNLRVVTPTQSVANPAPIFFRARRNISPDPLESGRLRAFGHALVRGARQSFDGVNSAPTNRWPS